MADTDLQQLKPASFAGIAFPYSKMSLHGGLRKHTHEFWKVDSGLPEKGGRKPYVARFTAIFHSNIRGYGKLFPDSMRKLRQHYESQVTHGLYLPHIGTMPAYAMEWVETIDPMLQSGMTVEMTFEEDGLDTAEDPVKAVASIESSLAVLEANMAQIKALGALEVAARKKEQVLADGRAALRYPYELTDPKRVGDLFDSIRSGADFVLGVRDQIDVYAASVVSRIDSTVRAITEVGNMVVNMDKQGIQTREACKNLQASLQAFRTDVMQTTIPIRFYRLLRNMTVSEVSIAIYGDTSHGMDILQLNPIENALNIPAGTEVRYYEELP